MAVWMQIIGIRKMNSFEKEKERIAIILSSENLDWKLKKESSIEYFEFIFQHEKIKVYFDHPNFIQFSGTSRLFAKWFEFADQKNKELTNEIRNVLKQVSAKCSIDELLYFSEWFFSLDDIKLGEVMFEELIQQIEKYPDLKSTELFGLESNQYYTEKVKNY
ncbi:hypothetical protein M0D21_02645 [Aquimarina sp. D1M17]|uniref:hypothetical protein n=1 Tax=Aquimarina acroporae TaxID=2937283 RepID=UPI0020C18837|nr:hypothetical protein [Aquimarina acroporae]MCK8520447.1 hypothetical protein [Aquimarina acroporae]